MTTIEQYLINKGRKEALQERREEALQEGREKGRQEGRQEVRIHTAIQLLKRGLDLRMISETMELSFKELEEIQAKV